jgi:hypothetical protein
MKKDEDPFDSPDIEHINLYLYLIPVFGFFSGSVEAVPASAKPGAGKSLPAGRDLSPNLAVGIPFFRNRGQNFGIPDATSVINEWRADLWLFFGQCLADVPLVAKKAAALARN